MNVPKARVAARATHTCTQATQFELIFPTSSRVVRIERALDAAIQIGGDRNEAALLLLEPDEV